MQRSATYAAEEDADHGTVCAETTPIEELQRLSSAITNHLWWQQNIGSRPIRVVAGKSKQRSYFRSSDRLIRLAQPHHNTSTLCHELAHAAVQDTANQKSAAQKPGLAATAPDHGSIFRAWHVSLRWLLYGERCGNDLLRFYCDYELDVQAEVVGLKSNAPPWISPVLNPSRYGQLRIVGRPFAQ